MHGLGNDFLVIDNFNGRIKLSENEITKLCDRHKGIGADGLILVENSTNGADCFMNYYNANGSIAEMCGNGIRCVANFLKNNYLKDKDAFEIETKAGVKKVILEDDGTFSVNMGKPVFSHEDFPVEKINLEGLEMDFVSMGNPHAVALVNDLDIFDLEKLGPIIENDKNFPNKINFELVEKVDNKRYKVNIWERGCGMTLACGTGACAVYAVIQKEKKSESEFIIELPGGELYIKENENGEIIMRGEAQSSFSGEVYLPR